jgi:Raf kinase inhibitor-like YbhB/YbcL family protein
MGLPGVPASMLEHVPSWLGQALRPVRAGAGKLAVAQPGLGTFGTLVLSSPAFADAARLPERFTADGTGISPPLIWTGVPEEAALLALLVEDADTPAPVPLAHAVIWGLPAATGRLAEGAMVRDGAGSAEGGDMGRNSFLRERWLPPDPPRGHGVHRYVFQVFALSAGVVRPGQSPGRSAVIDAMVGHVLAAGVLTGTYSRGEPARPKPGRRSGGRTATVPA